MVSEIKKEALGYNEEEGVDEIGLEGDIEEEDNPFYEEDENGEEFMQ